MRAAGSKLRITNGPLQKLIGRIVNELHRTILILIASGIDCPVFYFLINILLFQMKDTSQVKGDI